MKSLSRIAALVIAACIATAATAATVTTSVWTQFTTTVTQPEVINLGGAIHVVTQITTPSDPCFPTDPCRSVPVTVNLNLAGVTGIGQSTGTRYRATGATTVTGSINLPGGFVVNAGFQLIPPNPIIPPTPIKVQVFLTASSTGNVTAPASQPQGLVSWWQAEGDATDALGINNATNHGAVFVAGRVGQAFGFGPFDFTQYVEAPSSPSLQPATVTVMAWVKNLGSPGMNQYVVAEGAKGCFAAAYALYTGPSGNLTFYISDGGNFFESPDASPSIWDGNWHLVAGTYDGAFVRLYVDGIQVGTGTPLSTAINYAGLDHTNFDIGAYRDSACTLGFTGAIDEVRLFNRALTPSEVQSVYQTTP
jgi:hypothetical protein